MDLSVCTEPPGTSNHGLTKREDPFSLLPPFIIKSEAIAHTVQLCRVKISQVVDLIPCTPLQEGLMAITAVSPGAYVSCFTFDIETESDVGRLQQAWNKVAAANSILRTRIVSIPTTQGDILLQAVLDDPLRWIEREKIDDGPDSRLRMGLGERLVGLSFISSSSSTLSRRLFLEIHHALYDGWSLDLILEEVERAYHEQPASRLLPMQYFIRHLQVQNQGEENIFWSRYFEGTRAIHFPTAVKDIQPQPNSQITLNIPNLTWRNRDYTRASIVSAAWAIVVATEMDTEEALFGMTVTGRQVPLKDVDLVVGPTIATVPRRVSLKWNMCCNHLLDEVQRGAAEMIPFEQTGIQKISRMSDSAALGCRFQSLLVLQPVDVAEDSTLSTRVLREIIDQQSGSTSDTYPVVVECQLDEDAVQVRVAFDSRIITQQRMEFVAENFAYAISQLSDSDSAYRQLTSLQGGSTDIHQAWEWNDTVPEPTRECVHNIISRKAIQYPLSPAIDAWDGSFTYGELEDLTTKIALHLHSRSLRGKVVSLLFEKSKWMPIAAVSVMKAGGVCLALDAQQPPARLKGIVTQAESELILCAESNISLAQQIGGHVLVVGPDRQWPRGDSSTLPTVVPSDALYVNFTSGSTGIPKGAISTHEGFCSSRTHQQKTLGFSESSRVLDFSSYAFDASWANCLHSLTSGGCLCIPAQEERDNDLAGCLKRYNINSVDLTPSVARIVGRESLSQLSSLILGGEPVVPEDANLAGPDTKIFNVYGPAECTITATLAELRPNDISIGRGAGVCTWVVNTDTDTLSKIGEVGELWLEGPLVGKGYLNDPQRTKESFIENPSWLVAGVTGTCGRPGRRGRHGILYRTGDLVRYRADGSLIFVGRKDTQVKIRGQRVELSEVEQHILDALPVDISATVVAELINPVDTRGGALVAFVTLKDAEITDMTEQSHNAAVENAVAGVLASLAHVIPPYLIPAVIIPLQRLPLLSSKKIDRKALRTLGASLYTQHRNTGSRAEECLDLQPSNDAETILQQVWMCVLNLSMDEVPINKSFARLGGDSITAMQAVSQGRLRNISFTVTDVLEASTIRKLAPRCKLVAPPRALELSQLGSAGEGTEDGKSFDLSPIQKMFFEAYPEGLNHWNQSFLLELERPVSTTLLDNALKAVVARHGMLRCRFEKDTRTGQWIQRVMPKTDGDASLLQAHVVDSLEQVFKTSRSRQQSLNLQHGPVFTSDLFQISSTGTQLLLLSAHHAIIDLVSWRILWVDIEDFVDHGKLLSHPTASFQQWCHHQIVVGSSLSPLSVLPYVFPEPPLNFWGISPSDNTYAGCEAHELSFDSNITSALFGAVNEALRTEPIEIMIAALMHSFLQIFPEREPAVVWLEGHGRESLDETPIDVTSTVGWFTTLHPLVVPISLGSTLVDTVRLAKDNRRRVPNKGQSYFSCRYHSESGREIFKGHGLPELVLNFSGQFQQLEARGGLFTRPDSFGVENSDIGEIAPTAKRTSMIEVNAAREENQFLVTFYIHKDLKHRERLKEWITSFSHTVESATEELLRHAPSFTLADLPLLPLSYSGLDMLLRQQLPRSGILPSDVVDIYPCLPAQEGILLSKQKMAASYSTSTVWSCVPGQGGSSVISTSMLEEAWRTVAQRHTILQSVFVFNPEGEGFVQVLLRDPHVHIVTVDAINETAVGRLEKLEGVKFTSREPEHAFFICQSSTGEVACRLDACHTLIDAASLSRLVEELTYEYEGTRLDPATPFRDVVSHVTSIPKDQRLSRWSKLLQNVKPCQFPIQATKSHHGGTIERFSYIYLPQPAVEGVTAFCRLQNVTRFVFIQVAWALVLAHFTGEKDVCFGYLSNGRDTPVAGIEDVVGPLMSLLVGRVDLRGSVEEVLHNTSQATITHRSIQHTSLAEIQHHLGISSQNLFNTTLSVRAADKLAKKGGITFHPQAGEDMHEFDVGLSVMIEHDAMEVVLEYRESCISAQIAQEAARVLAQAFEFLLTTTSDQDSNTHLEIRDASDSFFRHVVGSESPVARKFWSEQFAGIQVSHFPSTPLTPTVEAVDDTLELDFQDFTSEGQEFTASTVLRAAWALLACRMTGSYEAVFGITVPSDTNTGTALPMRVVVDMQDSVAKFLRRIESQGDDIRQFGRIGYHWLKSLNDEAAVARDFRAVVEVQDDTVELPPVHAGAISIRYVLSTQRCARLQLRFHSSIMAREQATRMLHQLRHITNRLLDTSLRDQTLNSVDMTSLEDLQQIWRWNATVPTAVNSTMHELITLKAREQPSAPCVCAWDGDLTYQQVDDLSTKLAIELVVRGVTPGSVILLLFEKSMWMPIAALAVMKSGAVAMATDTNSQPEQRLVAMVEKVQAAVCLSSLANVGLAGRLCGTVVIVGSELHKSPLYAPERLLPAVGAKDILFVQFTSGSTGVPKAVKITHGNMCSAVTHQGRALGYHKDARVLDFASYSFDVFWSNLLNTLTIGACLCVPSDEERHNDLSGALTKYAVNFADLTPSIARYVSGLENLSTLVLGGEVVLSSDRKVVGNDASVCNAYGPAECTPTATILQLSTDGIESSIGRTVGLCAWIVSQDNPTQLSSVGAPGELWLEGPLVGEGYVGDGNKTAQQFVHDPEWLLRGVPGHRAGRLGRLYRTGDIVQYHEDGSLLFIGRADTMVKIRGRRVELEEVQHGVRTMLLSVDTRETFADVEVVVEVVLPLHQDNHCLVAFVSLRPPPEDHDVAVRQITSNAGEKLTATFPSYMIPSAFVPLQKIPRLTTGKTDRRGLRTIGPQLLAREINYITKGGMQKAGKREPCTPNEKLLQRLWAEITKVDPKTIGLDDSFFRLGGDSIGAMRLVGLARREGMSGLTVGDIFRHPLLGDLASAVEA